MVMYFFIVQEIKEKEKSKIIFIKFNYWCLMATHHYQHSTLFQTPFIYLKLQSCNKQTVQYIN